VTSAIASSYGAGFSLLMFGHWYAAVANLVLAILLDRYARPWWAGVDKKRFEVWNSGALYLQRWHLLRNKTRRVFLHHIARADMDRDLHNHPWPKAFAIILRGGYEELVRDKDGNYKLHKHGLLSISRHAFHPEAYHKILGVRPNTWTLFFAGERKRSWGFLVTDFNSTRHVDYRTYLGLPADHELED